jgi:putative SOS response-associated peptidase YedK
MPAILFEDEENLWIDKSYNTKDVVELLRPFPSELLYAYPVSSKVNSIKNNSKDLIIEVPEPGVSQGTLF